MAMSVVLGDFPPNNGKITRKQHLNNEIFPLSVPEALSHKGSHLAAHAAYGVRIFLARWKAKLSLNQWVTKQEETEVNKGHQNEAFHGKKRQMAA